MGEKGALQGKSKSNRQGSEHQEVETGNDLGLWKSLNPSSDTTGTGREQVKQYVGDHTLIKSFNF